MPRDIAIIGSGPAALAVAVACAERGASVTVVGGDDVGWAANYGAWVDEFESLGLGAYLGPVWADADVYIDGDAPRSLGRGYGRVARTRLRNHFLTRLAACGAPVVWQRAVDVRHSSTGSVVTLADDSELSVALVIDASGHFPAFVERAGEPTAWQAAFGILGTVDAHPWAADRMTYMDFRPAPAVDPLAGIDATFLYAMPMAPRRLFVEETSLVRTPAMPWSTLRARLQARLDRHGVTFEDIESTELCLFPVDTPLPRLGQRVVGFGAAASMVHPATGYLLARTLREAPELAQTVCEGLDAGNPPARVAADAWRCLWTEERLVARQLYLYGMRIVRDLPPAEVASFFARFFDLPESSWRAYLAGDAPLRQVASAMLTVFGRADGRLRWTLARSGHELPGALWRRASA